MILLFKKVALSKRQVVLSSDLFNSLRRVCGFAFISGEKRILLLNISGKHIPLYK